MEDLPEISLLGLCTALGLGLLIGIERERRVEHGSVRGAAGIRTFTMVALLGACGTIVAGTAGLAIAVLITAAIALGAYLRYEQEDRGVTSEFALVLTCVLGGLAQRHAAIAAAIGVVVAALLLSRSWLHELVRDRLTDREVADALWLATAALVILPFMPDRALDPFGVVNPRTVWKLAVVVMAINAAGYVAVRTLGRAKGLPLAGLAGGFVSSAATIGSMGSRARATPQLRRPAIAGAALSSVATVVQLAIVVAITDATVLAALWPSLVGAGVVALAYGGLLSIHALRSEEPEPGTAGRAFQPKLGLVFASVVTATLFLSAGLQHLFGNTGGIAGVGIAGFADAHSSAVSAASLVQTGALGTETGVFAILLALSTNTVTKTIVAWTTGGTRFALQLLPGLVLMLAAAWLGWLAAARLGG